jgi:hypothetical protein
VNQILTELSHILIILLIWNHKILSICISEALSDEKFQSFERDISSRNSHIFEDDLINHFAGCVQELDRQTILDRHIWRSLLSLK